MLSTWVHPLNLRKLIAFPLNLLQFKDWRLYETPRTVTYLLNKWLSETMTTSNHPKSILAYSLSPYCWRATRIRFRKILREQALPAKYWDWLQWDNRLHPLDSYWETLVFRQVVLKTGVILTPGDIGHCLETFLVVSTERWRHWHLVSSR